MPRQNPDQLRMFMSAREIQTEYAPNQPDRMYHGTDISVSRASGVRLGGGPDPREGQGTFRTRRTDDVVNEVNKGPRLAADKREVARRGGQVKPYFRGFRDLRGPYANPETNEQLYSRKLGEAQRGRGGNSLQARIKSEGVQTPIALGELTNAAGQRMIAGGHHRVAVMAHLSPDQLLPVVHVKNVLEANTKGY